MSEPYDVIHVHPAPCPICGLTVVVEPSESEPTVDILDVQPISRGASETIGVSYHANSPVTIIWRVNDVVISRQHSRIPHGQTQLTIRRFDYEHRGKTVSVEVVDKRGRSVSTSCTLAMRGY